MVSTMTELDHKNRRRSIDKNGRRFVVKERLRKRAVPSPNVIPRKTRIVNRAMRIMSFTAAFFIFLATSIVWHTRSTNRRPILNRFSDLGTHRTIAEKTNFSAHAVPVQINHVPSTNDEPTHLSMAPPISGPVDTSDKDNMPSSAADQGEEVATFSNPNTLHKPDAEHDSPTSGAVSHTKQLTHSVDFEDELLPNRIEWYSRDDYKLGTRPMCRISSPYILTNGTILVPEWMEEFKNLLQRCGLGEHSYYPTSGPPGLDKREKIDADFALTIHLDKFQEPTHAASIYLTEHILKASYLFDVFGGDAHHDVEVEEHHCYTTPAGANCTLPRPAKTLMKPALFVPNHIERGPADAWSRKLVDMFGVAYGYGHGVIHLNTSSLLVKKHRGKSQHILGTLFRSILTTDGMFRHLPNNALRESNFYSQRNGIIKAAKPKPGHGCTLSIGIASVQDQDRGISYVSDLRDRIEMLAKLAVPDSSITVKEVEFSDLVSLETHVKQIQDLDIYIAGTGDELSSMGYLRLSSSVFELMPFGIVPNTHESLARALGIPYTRIQGKPQVEFFKSCIEEEIKSLRKKGKISFSDPDWYEPLVKAWDDAVTEYATTGKSSFDVLSASPPIRNYYSRVCAQRQKVEVDIDETTRTIVKSASEKCRK